jgi:DNA-binding NtrC family response regulator
MMTVVDDEIATAIFLDDELPFLKAIKGREDHLSINVAVTANIDQSLDWLRDGRGTAFVSDLKMPGRDGVTVLEEAHRIRPEAKLALLTGHSPTREQRVRLNQIGAEYYSKDAVEQLLQDLSEQLRDREHHDLDAMRSRIRQLERLNGELLADFVAELRRIRNPDEQVVVNGDDVFTVAELISDLEQQTPRGIEHVRLWLRAFGTLRQMGRRK